MTKEFNPASGKYYDSEILDMLNSSVQIKEQFVKRAKDLLEAQKNQLKVALKRRNHYEKTGRLLPEVTNRD